MKEVARRLKIAGWVLVVLCGITLGEGLWKAKMHNLPSSRLEYLTQVLDMDIAKKSGQPYSRPDTNLLRGGASVYGWHILIGGAGTALGVVLLLVGWVVSGKSSEDVKK